MHKTWTKRQFMKWRNRSCLILWYGIPMSRWSKEVKTLIIFIFFLSVSVAFLKWKWIITKTCNIPDYTADYVRLLCQTEKYKQETERELGDMISVRYNQVQGIESQLISVARQINLDNREILFTVINEAYLLFTYSWLCNTKPMDIHSSVLIVTADKQTKEKLKRDWPGINVISMDLGITKESQDYKMVGYFKIIVKRTELIQALLMANINVFVFEVDSLWLANPLSGIQIDQQDDVIVNPVSMSKGRLFAGGFILLRSTCRAKILWQKLTNLMVSLRKNIEIFNETELLKKYEEESDQYYLAKLINDGYANVSLKILPLELYADGKWYELSEIERLKMHPVIINNNWVIGNNAKIERAKQWNHWFIQRDFTCDMDLVYKTIY